MRFTDGRENLEIIVHEGQHGYDMTAVFFGNTPASDENGIHHIESVRALLKDTLEGYAGQSSRAFQTPRPRRGHMRDLRHHEHGRRDGQRRLRAFIRHSRQHVLQRLRMPAYRRERKPLRRHWLVWRLLLTGDPE